MSASSVSKTSLILEIKGRFKLSCDLKRHLSPRTVGFILRALPIQGNAHRLGDVLYVETPVDSGVERARKEFKKGDVAFLPANGGVCFFTKDAVPGKTLSIIGKVSGDLSALDTVKPGDVVMLYADAA